MIPVVSEDPGFDGMHGLVSEALEHFVPFDDHEIYLAGPPAMITATVTRLHEMGVAASCIHHDTLDGGRPIKPITPHSAPADHDDATESAEALSRNS